MTPTQELITAIVMLLFMVIGLGCSGYMMMKEVSDSFEECYNNNISDEHIIQLGDFNYSCGTIRAINATIAGGE